MIVLTMSVVYFLLIMAAVTVHKKQYGWAVFCGGLFLLASALWVMAIIVV